MDELFQSVKGQIILAAIGILLLAAFVRWCRDVAMMVRQARSGEQVKRELPSEFTRWPALLMLAAAAVFLSIFHIVGTARDDDTAIALVLTPCFVVMGLAGLIDPRLMWAVHPDAKGKLSATIRFVGTTLAVLSFLAGLGWFVWLSLA